MYVGLPAGLCTLTAQFQFDLEWLLLAIILVGLILLGAFVIVRFKRWQGAERSPPVPTRIEDYRALMEKGLLEAPEFERIRDQLEKKSASPPPAVPPASPSPGPQPPLL
jgi:hypothetical protein